MLRAGARLSHHTSGSLHISDSDFTSRDCACRDARWVDRAGFGMVFVVLPSAMLTAYSVAIRGGLSVAANRQVLTFGRGDTTSAAG
jgi:hypothetical protein